MQTRCHSICCLAQNRLNVTWKKHKLMRMWQLLIIFRRAILPGLTSGLKLYFKVCWGKIHFREQDFCVYDVFETFFWAQHNLAGHKNYLGTLSPNAHRGASKLKLSLIEHFYNFNLALAAVVQQLQCFNIAILVNTASVSIVGIMSQT